jgi:hypothetical protein
VFVDSVICKNEISSFLCCEAMLITVKIVSEQSPKEMIFEAREEILRNCVRTLLNVHHIFAPQVQDHTNNHVAKWADQACGVYCLTSHGADQENLKEEVHRCEMVHEGWVVRTMMVVDLHQTCASETGSQQPGGPPDASCLRSTPVADVLRSLV